MRHLLFAAIAAFGFYQSVEADTFGKVELAPAYVHLDILEQNKTVQRVDMAAIRFDGLLVFWDGWCIKPMAMYGKNQAELFSAGIGIGHCIPWECYYLTPSVGISFTNINTTFKFSHPFGTLEFHEQFRSYSPYISLELTTCFSEDFRISYLIQWAWARTHTHIKHLIDVKGHSSGPNFGVHVEYDVAKCWSVSVAGGYNKSLSETKDGVRAWGGKVGIERWF